MVLKGLEDVATFSARKVNRAPIEDKAKACCSVGGH